MRIGFVANRGFALWSSRRRLMARLRAAGHEVFCYSVDDGYRAPLEEVGAVWREVPLQRGGPDPRTDPALLFALRRAYAADRLDLVQHYHAKPMVFGSLAARWAGVPRVVNTVTGLGESLPTGGLGRTVSVAAYRVAGDLSDRTVFQNSDDLALFQREGLVAPGAARLIVSSGVDVDRFRPPAGEGGPEAPRRVLFMSRLLHAKGVAEFIEAARIVRREVGPDVVFELAGEWDRDHGDAVTEAEMAAMNADGAVRFVGYCSDPDSWLPGAVAFVCPSYYREGVPRTILEANACGVPVIGADSAGIRDAVRDGVTGFLVPPMQADAIADRLLRLLGDPDLARGMGQAARREAEQRFDLDVITRAYLSLYEGLGVPLTTEVV